MYKSTNDYLWSKDTGDCPRCFWRSEQRASPPRLDQDHVPGAFGEANKELDSLLHRLTKLTAKTPLATDACPQNQSKWKICWKGDSNALSPDTGSANCNSQCFDVSHEIASGGQTPEEAMLLANKECHQKFWNPNTNCPSYFEANHDQSESVARGSLMR
jgi:hypothetical protein